MVKYTAEIKEKAVELVKAGKTVSEITAQLGCNAKAIQRYCEAAGVVIPKRIRKTKV